MSTQLEALGIDVIQGFEAAQLDPAPDVVVVGNVMTRGQPVIEALLESGIPYASGPEWLSREVLKDRWVLAVAGTHGKTTTSSLLAWILEHAGLSPGFLIGGVPANFDTSARLGEAPFFVIEADEYDTAFFDKRAKFVHYRPRTAILNNLEYDHADIYPDVAVDSAAVPSSGAHRPGQRPHRLECLRCAARGDAGDGLLDSVRGICALAVLAQPMRCGRPVRQATPMTSRSSKCWRRASRAARFSGRLIGAHNMENALAAIAAARHAGVTVEHAIEALESFKGIARRMQLRGEVNGVRVYDDFAHHPTAIATTVDGLRRRVGNARIIAVLEPRSNTMKMGVHQKTLGPSLLGADEVWLFTPPDLGWDAEPIVASLGSKGHASHEIGALASGAGEVSPAG